MSRRDWSALTDLMDTIRYTLDNSIQGEVTNPKGERP